MGSVCGASIGSAWRVFNGLLIGLALTACTPDPPAVEGADGGEAGDGTARLARDAEVVPAVPVPPLDLLKRMPQPPSPIAAVPGDRATGLTKARPRLRPSDYTPRILIERPPEGPFKVVHYQLDREQRSVRAVLATFVRAYTYPDRREALEEAIRIRLGKGEALTGGNYEGLKWTTMAYRIELRTDKATGDLELLYHARGAVDPVEPPQ